MTLTGSGGGQKTSRYLTQCNHLREESTSLESQTPSNVSTWVGHAAKLQSWGYILGMRTASMQMRRLLTAWIEILQ